MDVCEGASIKEAVGFYKPLAVLVLGLCPCPSLNRDLSNLSEAVWSAFDWIYWFAATHRLTWLWQDGCFITKQTISSTTITSHYALTGLPDGFYHSDFYYSWFPKMMANWKDQVHVINDRLESSPSFPVGFIVHLTFGDDPFVPRSQSHTSEL